MKKIFITTLAIALLSPLSVWAYYQGFGQYLGSPITEMGTIFNASLFSATTVMVIQSATEQAAISFTVQATTSIVAVDMYLIPNGIVSGTKLTFDIETMTGNLGTAPSGTLVGGATVAFNVSSSTGWTGMQNLTATSTLSPNTPYSLVLKDGGGTAPTVTNFAQGAELGNTQFALGYSKQNHYNGSTWNSVRTANVIFVLKDSNGNYYGSPISSAVANSPFRLYNGNYYGLNFRVGGYAYLNGVVFYGGYGSAPGLLAISLYQNKTLLETVNLTTSSITNGSGPVMVTWSKPYLVTSNTDYQITFNNTTTGSSGVYYYLKQAQINPTYSSLVYPANWYTFTGSSTPSTWTASTTEMSMITPMIGDPGTGFSLPTTRSLIKFLNGHIIVH